MAASKLTNEEKLKRWIYVNSVEGKYISGGPDQYTTFSDSKKELLDEFIKNSPKDLLNIIISANEDKLIPHRATLYYILACALKSEKVTDEIKSEICATVLKICKSDEEFFNFIKYVTTLKINKKIPPTIIKTIKKFYNGKSPKELANSFAMYTSYHGWSHKDLIKLAHVKSATPLKNVVVNYILFKKSNDKEGDTEEKGVVDLLKKSTILKKTTDHRVAVPIIDDLKANINQVQPSLRKSAEVWNAVLPYMSLPEVLQVLPKLYKLGFLKKDSPTQALINDSITNVEKIKASGIHPVNVFICMKNFEKGGRHVDAKLLVHLMTEKKLTDDELKRIISPNDVRSPVIMSNLQKCMHIACNNIQPTGKRYLITVDVTDKMNNPSLHIKNVTALEAATAFAMTLLKVEKDVTVAVFKQKEISVIQLEKKGQFHEHIQKLKENKNAYLVPAAPIEWAMTQKKHIDIFINFIHHSEYYLTIPKDVKEKVAKPAEILQKYKKKFNLQNAKLITCCMSSPHLHFADGSSNILDVAGLDFGVPKLLEAFCRGILVESVIEWWSVFIKSVPSRGWRSSTVAEGYIEDSHLNKENIANSVLKIDNVSVWRNTQ